MFQSIGEDNTVCTVDIQTFSHHQSIVAHHKTSLVNTEKTVKSLGKLNQYLSLSLSAGPYQNPFSNYYAAAAAAVERRSGAIMSHTLEPYDNKGSPSTHERMAAYAHSSLTALTSLSTRNLTNPAGETDDERHGPGNAPGNTPGSSEFSGLVSYFSSQQDDLDS